MLSAAPSIDWVVAHRDAWARKPSLRAVYRRWFRALRDGCADDGPILELGCGPGLFKELYPDVIATDADVNPYADRIVDAGALPFADGALASIVMLDVFHHLPEPERFLREAARTLRGGGRVVMIEPWLGLAGRLFFRHVHHEICDLRVDPAAPWAGPDKDPMHGNVALPYLFFQPGGHLERLDLQLRLVRREPFAALPWLLSGGFQSFGFLPLPLVGTAEGVDAIVSRLPRLTATRCLIALERDASAQEPSRLQTRRGGM
jgi:SAM-dependent methyltransferase